MPPAADRLLEERILKAARRLWRMRGDEGLTLRAVARTANTTTPTLYKRFRSKETLRLALASRLRQELDAALFASSNLEEVCRGYLRYVERNPREYELLQMYWAHFFGRGNPRPLRVWILTQLAARFGGKADTYELLYDTCFLLCHGTATLLVLSDDPRQRKSLHDACICACDRLLENFSILRA